MPGRSPQCRARWEGIPAGSSGRQIGHFSSLSTVRHTPARPGSPHPAASGHQQPRQMFFSRAFISLSSAAIESTYFAGSFAASALDGELGDDAGLAATDGAAPGLAAAAGAAGAGFLSKQASLAAESDIDLHCGGCAAAASVSAKIAASTTNDLLIQSFKGLTYPCHETKRAKRSAIVQLNQRLSNILGKVHGFPQHVHC